MLTRATARQVFDLLPSPVVLLDTLSHVVEVNPASCSFFGCSHEELVGRPLDDLLEGETRRASANVGVALEGGSVTFVARMRRSDGTERVSQVRLALAAFDDYRTIIATLEDVSDRAKTEEELRQSDQRYALLVKHLPRSVTMVFDRDLRFRLADGPEIEAAGSSKEALEGKLLSEAVPPEFAAVVEPLWRRVLDGESFTMELPWQDRFYEYNYTPLRDASGSVVYGMVVGVNVTERRRAEEALRSGEARLRAITEHTPAFIAELDRDGTVSFLNRARGGSGVEDVIGTAFLESVPTAERGRLGEAFEKALAGEIVTIDHQGTPPSGEPRSYTSVLAPIGPPNDRRVAMSLLDVTDQRAATAAARTAAQRLADVARHLPGALFQTEVSPDGRTRMRFISEGSTRVYGATPEECMADIMRVVEGVSPEETRALADAWRKSIDSMDRMNSVHRARRADGSVHWIEVVAAPRKESDGTIVFSGYALDVTERVLAEKEREHLIDELRKRTAEMEQFVYTVSHDLKSPLVTIKGFLGFVEKDLAGGDLSRATGDLKRIGSAADKMMELLGDLLELSRVGRAAHNATRVSLADAAREALALVRGAADASGAEVTIEADLPDVLADRGRIVQVFQNLLENAIKCKGERAHPSIEVGLRPDPERVVCFVRDAGVGIEPQHTERIFRLFEKLDPRSEGTGVGLALVRRIIEFHGGRVWAESHGLGKGATFLFSLAKVDSGLPSVRGEA